MGNRYRIGRGDRKGNRVIGADKRADRKQRGDKKKRKQSGEGQGGELLSPMHYRVKLK